MSVESFLSTLRSLDVQAWVEGEQLRVSAPKGVLTAEHRQRLSAQKAEIIAYLRTVNGTSQPTAPPLKPAPRTGPQPLSFAQEGLWFLERLMPGTAAYNVPVALPLGGPLDVAALERSLEEILRRHEALRTTFQLVDGQPAQIVGPPAAFALPVVDLRYLPEEAREGEAERLTVEEAGKPFDLARGPLFRATLVRVGDDSYRLLLNMHHIVSDGWSLGVLTRELGALYQAYAAGHAPALPALPIQYGDFARWQREYLQGDVLERHLRYWKRALGGDLPPLDLPLDRPRPAEPSLRGAVRSFEIEASLCAQLAAVSRQEGATLFMTLLAAFDVLLYRYTGQTDIVVGTPVANRNREEIEGLVGLFVNTLALRTDLGGDPTFRALLRRVREVALEGYAHQDLPFELVVQELRPQRDTSRPPLFQVMFAFEKVRFDPLTVGTGASRFDLTLFLWEQADRLTGLFEYSTDLFDAATIERMVGHFLTVLREVAANPDARMSEVSLLSEAERHQVLVAWNATAAPYPDRQTIHDLFVEQAGRTPGAVAVIAGDERLTYRDLDAAAERVAERLRARGVRVGSPVAVCLSHSPAMVAALLGVLRAGGAYLPLDPAHPAERLAFQLADSGAPVLLTERALRAGPLAALSSPAAIVCLDEAEPEAAARAAAAWEAAGPDDPAYIIYTSGSTGQPKGVRGTHRGAVNRFAWMWATYPFEPGEVACQKTTLSFVDAVWELFGPLLRGVPVVLAPAEARGDPRRLVTLLAEHGVTRLVLVPSLLRALIEAFPALGARLPRLRYVITSGEALAPDLARQFEAAAPVVRLLNLYGSSEVAADATCYDPAADPAAGAWRSGAARVPIGRPIANTRTYVLDSAGHPTPIGVGGDLYVGGAGLALDYLNRLELTAERFVPDPYSTEPGARLYKTGDLARWRADGQLEYLGRGDHQVKVRGVRVELGEVEMALRRHPAVDEAAVVAYEPCPGDVRLAAYLTAAPGAPAPGAADLRHFLRGLLPDVMLPASFTAVTALPLTVSGKLDRRALPAPGQPEPAAAYVPPRTPTEQTLAGIWGEVLGVERVGIHDDFFALGGHSLLAVRLFTAIERQLGARLPLMKLFEGPTVARLAALIDGDAASGRWSSLVELRRGQPDRLPFFAIHAVDGDVFWYEPLARYLGPNQPFFALRARGMDGVQEPLTRFEAMAAYYIEEIRQVQPHGPYQIGGFSWGGSMAFEMARQLQARGEAVALLAIIDHAPLQSDYYCAKRDLGYAIRYAQDVPLRVRRFLREMDNEKRRAVLLAKATRLAELTRLKRATLDEVETAAALTAERIAELLYGNVSALPPHHRNVVLANSRAILEYTPGVYRGRITVFRAAHQPVTCSPDPEMAWGALTTDRVAVRTVPGWHLTIMQEPNVKNLARELAACLADTSDLRASRLQCADADRAHDAPAEQARRPARAPTAPWRAPRLMNPTRAVTGKLVVRR